MVRSADVTKPESAALLTKAVKGGALLLGEIKNQVECDGPEMKRMYALAADLNVPIQIHFGDVPQASGNAVFNGGFKRFDSMLKAYPQNQIHCPRGHVLGQRERRLRLRHRIPERSDQARRHQR